MVEDAILNAEDAVGLDALRRVWISTDCIWPLSETEFELYLNKQKDAVSLDALTWGFPLIWINLFLNWISTKSVLKVALQNADDVVDHQALRRVHRSSLIRLKELYLD